MNLKFTVVHRWNLPTVTVMDKLNGSNFVRIFEFIQIWYKQYKNLLLPTKSPCNFDKMCCYKVI